MKYACIIYIMRRYSCAIVPISSACSDLTVNSIVICPYRIRLNTKSIPLHDCLFKGVFDRIITIYKIQILFSKLY